MEHPMTSLIADARAFLGCSLAEVQDKLGPAAEPIPGDEYGQMEVVTSIEDPDAFPGTIYLQDDVVELVRIGRRNLTSLTRTDLDGEFGGNAVRLRSRSGKRANLWVHAEQGVAYSAQDDALDFLEVFRPRPQQRYEDEIYRDPGPFIR
jgi:hypothetical protein